MVIILNPYPYSQVVDVREVLDLRKDISQVINKVLSMPPPKAKGLIGKTTRTAFRRIHEILASVLDQALSGSASLHAIHLGIAKSLVLIKYQCTRGQLSPNLAQLLTNVLNNLINVLNRESNLAKAAPFIERCRVFIDSLLVLVYSYGVKK